MPVVRNRSGGRTFYLKTPVNFFREIICSGMYEQDEAQLQEGYLFNSFVAETIYRPCGANAVKRDNRSKNKSFQIISLILILACTHSSLYAHTTAKSDDLSNLNASTQQSKKAEPYKPEAVQHYNRAVELHQRGSFSEAIIEYEDSIKVDDRMIESWVNLGCLFAGRKLYPEAIRAYQKALDLSEKLDDPRQNEKYLSLAGLADVYFSAQDYAQAEPYYKRAIATNRLDLKLPFASTLKNYAKLLRKTNRESEAEAIEKRADTIERI